MQGKHLTAVGHIINPFRWMSRKRMGFHSIFSRGWHSSVAAQSQSPSHSQDSPLTTRSADNHLLFDLATRRSRRQMDNGQRIADSGQRTFQFASRLPVIADVGPGHSCTSAGCQLEAAHSTITIQATYCQFWKRNFTAPSLEDADRAITRSARKQTKALLC